MDSVAELNNEGVMWLECDRYHEASICFENALHILLSKSSRDRDCCGGAQLREESCMQATQINENNCKLRNLDDAADSTSIPSNYPAIFRFFGNGHWGMAADEEEDNDLYFSSSILETHGVVIETHLLKYQISLIDGLCIDAHSREGERLLFLTLLSAVVLFNMALTNHLAGTGGNHSKKLENACRLYRKARTLLASLKITDATSETSSSSSWRSLPFPSSIMVDMLYMACWNNEAYLAFCEADFDLSRYCFENLHRSSMYFMLCHVHDDNVKNDITSTQMAIDTSLLEGTAPLSPNSIFSWNPENAILLESLKRMASDFVLNAAIYRNNVTSPAA